LVRDGEAQQISHGEVAGLGGREGRPPSRLHVEVGEGIGAQQPEEGLGDDPPPDRAEANAALPDFGLLEDVEPEGEVVRIVVELRDGDAVSELSQTAVAATSGTAVDRVV